MVTFDNIKDVMSMDPFDIKKSLVDLVDKNLGIGNNDLYEAGFLGYFIQAQTLLTSDVLFNNSMAWNEAFTHLLVLPTSLQNHAMMFDYKLSSVTPCQGNITIYVPFPESGTYNLVLKNGTICDSNISYFIKNTYIINLSNNIQSVQKQVQETGLLENVNINIEIREGVQYLIFNAEVIQLRVFQYEEKIQNIYYNEYYDINIGGIEDEFYDINVAIYLNDEQLNTLKYIGYEKKDSIYSCNSTTNGYIFKYYGNGMGVVRFGNGIYGKQPQEGSTASILIYTSKGNNGIVYPGQITLNIDLFDINTNQQVTIVGTNLTIIDNGINEENIEAAKNNIIAQTSSARRLVTKDDYEKFENIIKINNNMEIYPSLLRRDFNINEIDLFTILYDTEGMPIPTTNINYVINSDRTLLTKEYIYKMAIKYGEKGIELIPNTLKIINENALDFSKHELYSAIYIDPDFDNYNELYMPYNYKIIYIYSDQEYEYEDPDEIKEFVCPFNINIKNREYNKIGILEYIPNKIKNLPNKRWITDYVNIEIGVNQTLFTFLPEESVRSSNIRTTHLNIINNLYVSNNIFENLIKSYVIITPIEDDEVIMKSYDCSLKYSNITNNEINTTCMIPINELPKGEFLFTYIINYSDKFYNKYEKYVQFIDKSDLSLVDKYINTPIRYVYDKNDLRIIPSIPAIEKLNISINNVIINWGTWKDENDNIINGYLFNIECNKFANMSINKLNCQLKIGYGSIKYDYNDVNEYDNNNITFIFKIPYNDKYISNGKLYYEVTILYKFNNEYDMAATDDFSPFIIYNGYITLKSDLSDLMWCNIELVENYYNEAYKVYKIPVIEKKFYDNNSQYIEENILNNLANINSSTIDYKMLTDKYNLKFAKTIGITENLKYNDNVIDINDNLLYKNWVHDIPPTIKVSLLLNRYTSRNKQDIINECKEVILSFLQLKANFNANIIRSEIARYVHDVIPDIISCEVLEPSKDILYFYSENDLPKIKDLILSYNPEFIWIDINKIDVDVILTPS